MKNGLGLKRILLLLFYCEIKCVLEDLKLDMVNEGCNWFGFLSYKDLRNV